MIVTVVGSGSWGTAIAGQAAAHADEVRVWSFGGEAVEGINTLKNKKPSETAK